MSTNRKILSVKKIYLKLKVPVEKYNKQYFEKIDFIQVLVKLFFNLKRNNKYDQKGTIQSAKVKYTL